MTLTLAQPDTRAHAARALIVLGWGSRGPLETWPVTFTACPRANPGRGTRRQPLCDQMPSRKREGKQQLSASAAAHAHVFLHHDGREAPPAPLDDGKGCGGAARGGGGPWVSAPATPAGIPVPPCPPRPPAQRNTPQPKLRASTCLRRPGKSAPPSPRPACLQTNGRAHTGHFTTPATPQS